MRLGKVKDPIVWTIAGSDSGAGSGLQADLKTMTSLGVHGCTVVTALTAQNSSEVLAIERSSLSFLDAQASALRKDGAPKAVKTGMLGSVEVARWLGKLPEINAYVVCDPVLCSSSGHLLTDKKIIPSLIKQVFPSVNLLTPNRMEAEALVGYAVTEPDAVEKAAQKLLGMGVKACLLKGGHSEGDLCSDFYTDGDAKFWIHSARLLGFRSHGTGCTLSAALASCHALGLDEKSTVVVAKAYLNRALRLSERTQSMAFLHHAAWPVAPEDFPWVTPSYRETRLKFPAMDRLGFYPVVNRFTWVERLVPLGLKVIQLRIKDLYGCGLEQEIRKSIEFCKRHDCHIVVNDHVELALKYGAYGVHLGQDDMAADLGKICGSGLRLGVSTHSYFEAALAHALGPSYISLGSIFPTKSHAMTFPPQGLDRIREWKSLFKYPVVAIGGITLERSSEVRKTGVDGVSVISDVLSAKDPEARTRAWVSNASIFLKNQLAQNGTSVR